MAAATLRKRLGPRSGKDLVVTSAGTHSIPGLPMSSRTREALASIDVVDRVHLSEQIDQTMADAATVIAIFEPMHLTYMRREHAENAHKVVSLPRLARELPAGPAHTLGARLATLAPEAAAFEAWEEIIDPAGGDLPVFVAAAEQIAGLIDELLPALDSGSSDASS